MRTTDAPNYWNEIPDVLQAFVAPGAMIEAHGIDRALFHLIKLRASQLNRCAFCVDMHTREARVDGETQARLDRLLVWEQVDDFSDRERAALAWTDALTELDPRTDWAGLRARLRDFFTAEGIAALTAAAALINLWNRIGVSRH
ncbi:MAG: carboxymuconolactone decarboxylase family protein [Nannocystaceae bacterium]